MLEEIPGLILYMPLQFYSSDFIGCNKGGDKTMALNWTDALTSKDLFDKHVNTLENLS